MKYLIFDAGPIISLTMNGLLPVLEKLKLQFKGEFIITPQVKKEVIDAPLNIKKYEFEGLKVKNLLEKGVLKMSSNFIPNNTLIGETKRIMDLINSVFISNEGKINLIQEGEASCIAFAKLLNHESVIVVDERTVRMVVEAPENLRQLMERKLHTSIKTNKKALEKIKNFKFIRSAELLYIAYKKNLFELKKDKSLLDALLYAVKFKGTAISSKEIEEIKRMA